VRLALRRWGKKGRIGLTGGEPLLKKELFPLLDYLDEAEEIESLSIISNGLLINERLIAQLKGISKLECVQISLDGVNSAIDEAIRGLSTFKRTVENMKMLKENGIRVLLLYTLLKSNLSDVPHLFPFFRELNFDGFILERFVPLGQGKRVKDQVLNAEEIRWVYQSILDEVQADYTEEDILVFRALRTELDPGQNELKLSGALCTAGTDGACILPDATLLPCRRFLLPLGNLKEESLFDLWRDSPLLEKIRNRENLKGKCGECSLRVCRGCRALAYALTGDFLSEDPQCWKEAMSESAPIISCQKDL